MRQLTKEQEEWVAHVNSEEFREQSRKNQEANEAARKLAQAQTEIKWAEYLARQREQEEAMRPLKEALKAAGIKLHLSSYEGVWGQYQIGDGPVVDIDDDSFDAFEED